MKLTGNLFLSIELPILVSLEKTVCLATILSVLGLQTVIAVIELGVSGLNLGETDHSDLPLGCRYC